MDILDLFFNSHDDSKLSPPSLTCIAWWTVFLRLLFNHSKIYGHLEKLPSTPYHHNRSIRQFIESPGPFSKAYDASFLLASIYWKQGWQTVFWQDLWLALINSRLLPSFE